MISINPDRHILISFTNKEQMAILSHAPKLPINIIEQVHKGRAVLSEQEYQGFLNIIKYISELPSVPKQQKTLQKLYERLTTNVVASTELKQANSWLPTEIQDLLANTNFSSFEEAKLKIHQVQNESNSKPDPEIGNLSPDQVTRLIYRSWDDLVNPLRLNKNLSPSDLEESMLLFNMQVLLSTLIDFESETATATGNLSRKVVKELCDKMRFEEGYLEDVARYNRVINETDVWELHLVRVVAECAGLISKRKKRFNVSKKAHEMLKPENIGQLYHLLFTTFFQKFNLSYLDGLPEYEGIQRTVLYSFYRLKEQANDWLQVEDLQLIILLPKVLEDLKSMCRDEWEKHWFVMSRIIKPLINLGLVEAAYGEKKYGRADIVKIRKTPLFDKFIDFEF